MPIATSDKHRLARTASNWHAIKLPPLPELPKQRKGAIRMSAIPREILASLNAGKEETITLVEWLAVDLGTLARAALAGSPLARMKDSLGRQIDELKGLGVSVRIKRSTEILFEAAAQKGALKDLYAHLAAHPSDTVRMWACGFLACDPEISFPQRMSAMRRFAADRHMGVRETAWDRIRPFIAQDLSTAIRLLKSWVADSDFRIRRCAAEATRPRGVWCAHIEALKANPDIGLPILEPLKSDSSDYVRRSVANWINDASKSRSDWAKRLCARWRRESATPETDWITRRALRTIEKAGALEKSVAPGRNRRSKSTAR